MELTRKQTKALDLLENNFTKELLYGGAAGGGKSLIGCYWQLKTRLKYAGTRGLIGRAVLKTLKDTTIKTFFEVIKLQEIKATKYNYNSQSNILSFNNGSEILFRDLATYPSDPEFDELGSLELTDAFVDEATQISVKAKQILKSRIRFKLDENGIIPKILYTCNPGKNWTYSEFYKLHKKGELPPNKAFIQSLVVDNPFISKHYIENLNTLDEISKQRLLYGNWEYDEDPTKLISYENILFSFNNIIPTGESYISADIARFGSDNGVIIYWTGLIAKEILTINHKSIPQTTAIIRDLAIKRNVKRENIIVDEDGVGGGVKDLLQCVGFVNNKKVIDNWKNNYANLKSQCEYKLAEFINDKKIAIICDVVLQEKITEELEQLKTWHIDNDKKLMTMPKDEIKKNIGRSPDYMDALKMRMYFELRKHGNYGAV